MSLRAGPKHGHYVECAFNYEDHTYAFIFSTDQCVLIDYAPGTTDDYIIRGPMIISDFFHSLKNTVFAAGIDAAFTSTQENVAYIFRSDMYARLNFVTGDIIGDLRKIGDGFTSLRGTGFEYGFDTAFASHRRNEAYLFKGDQCVLIHHTPGGGDEIINGPKKIADSFWSLKDTVFADGLDAAFTAKATNEAYIFKEEYYARINYAPGTTDDKIIGKIYPITEGFPSLKDFVPRT